MSGEMVSGTGQSIKIEPTEKSLTRRIWEAFEGVVVSELKGKVPERSVKVIAKNDEYHPVLTFLIQDQYSGTKTTVEIPVGLANPDHSRYFASINGKGTYKIYKKPEDIGYEAAEVFRRDYTSDVRGL